MERLKHNIRPPKISDLVENYFRKIVSETFYKKLDDTVITTATAFQHRINPETGMENRALIAGVLRDLNDGEEGMIIIRTSEQSKKGSIPPACVETRTIDFKGEKRTLVLLVLNLGSKGWLTNGYIVYIDGRDNFKKLIGAAAESQATVVKLLQEGKPPLTRREYSSYLENK